MCKGQKLQARAKLVFKDDVHEVKLSRPFHPTLSTTAQRAVGMVARRKLKLQY